MAVTVDRAAVPSPAGRAPPRPTATSVERPAALPGSGATADPPPSALSSATAAARIAASTLGIVGYPPKDECSVLPGFVSFRDKLAGAIRRRDAEALAALADRSIRLDFGGGSGRDELRRRLSSRPRLWGELQDVLPLGCAVDADLATMLWIFSRIREAVDATAAMLVVGDKVPLRAALGGDAASRGDVGWAMVTPPGDAGGDGRFCEVETVNASARGFVEAKTPRSLLDYRLIVEPQGGTWAITAFVAGD